MSKELLEEIKEHVKWTVENGLQPRVEDSDLEWLINRVEELEKEIKSHAPEGRNYTNKQYVDLLQENQRYKQAIQQAINHFRQDEHPEGMMCLEKALK